MSKRPGARGSRSERKAGRKRAEHAKERGLPAREAVEARAPASPRAEPLDRSGDRLAARSPEPQAAGVPTLVWVLGGAVVLLLVAYLLSARRDEALGDGSASNDAASAPASAGVSASPAPALAPATASGAPEAGEAVPARAAAPEVSADMVPVVPPRAPVVPAPIVSAPKVPVAPKPAVATPKPPAVPQAAEVKAASSPPAVVPAAPAENP